MKPGAAQEVLQNHCCPTLVVAGTGSGVGKTSLAVGLCRALRQKGLVVQAFKCGPDFIDPMHHQEATGRPSINLDTWMLSREQVLGAFHRAAAGVDVAVVEGVMGLFDGRDGATEAGSTAQLAKWLGAPVLLVLDASAVARSAAAVAKGYIEFDAQLRLGALLFNRVGGPAHTQWLRDALTAAGIAAPVLGGVPKSDAVSVPERHLGLHLPADATVPPGLADALADLVSTHVDLDALLELARTAEVPPASAEQLQLALPAPAQADAEPAGKAAAGSAAPPPAAAPVRIAVAQDAAFCFYYHDNLALLRAAGAELVPFSPLVDALPPDVAGVYIGGGYPERHAADLADNRVLRAGLEAFARAGGVVYAECGGLIYLSKSIQPAPDEAAIPMVGVFPFRTVMGGPGGMRMGYVEVETRFGCPVFPAGARVRGQVFHFSEIVQESVVSGLGAALTGRSATGQPWRTCYTVTPQIPGAAAVEEGYCLHNVLASYVHLHFGACPELAAALVERCRGVDVAAVGAAAHEAAQTACYLESAMGSLHASPQLLGKGVRGVPHCRSSPDLAREGQLNGKQRATAMADPHRHLTEDGLVRGRHSSDATPHHHLVRHGGMLHSAAAINGVAGGPPSLSPATTLSKVVSLNSLASCSPHVVGALPPGDALSPPLSDSPQQLSPRELEAQQREAEQQQQQFFGSARDGREGAPPVPPLPLGALQQQQQLHQQQQQQQYMQQQGYGVHGHYAASMQQQAYAQPPYANGHAAGHAEQHPHQHSALYRGAGGLSRPPLGSSGSLSQLAAASSSWPRLHPQPQANGSLPPPAQHAYAPTSARGGASAFAMQQPSLHPQQQQHAYGGSPSTTAYYAANGAAGGFHPASSRHSRNGSVCYDRPGSAGQPGMLVARSPSPLDLAGLERLDPQPLALTATPYNWQHSHTPSDKIVSLSPGATEMLWALGLGARVAAVTDACDHPPEAGARAKARRSLAVPPGRTASYASLERHPSVSSGSNSGAASRRESPTVAGGRSGAAAWAAAAADGQLAEVVDEEVLARERPGLVVYEEAPEQACCGGGAEGLPPGSALCASGCGMGRAVLEALVAVGLQQSCRVVCVRRRTLADVLDSMLLVGEAAGVREEALCTVDRLRARLRRAAGEAAAAAAAAPSRPRVLVLQSLRPLRTAGWWVPDQLTLAGGACGLEEAAGDPPQDLTWEQVQAFAPDVLVVAGMAAGTALRPLTDLCAVAALPGWWLLPAVRASSVFIADAALFCRGGPRLVEGVECLARMLWGSEAAPGCACPKQAVLKLSLRPGQRCRPRLLPNHFVPFGDGEG